MALKIIDILGSDIEKNNTQQNDILKITFRRMTLREMTFTVDKHSAE
jgi:hypothetical protein